MPATNPASARSGPFVRVLGTAQDGGLPHAACSCQHCRAARNDPARRRLVASLAVVLPESGKVFLIDASPDLRQQLELLDDVRSPPRDRVDRSPVDGVFLTHTHIGHYLGLAFFGFEAVHTRQLPLYVTPSVESFLRQNGPWSQLVDLGNVSFESLEPGAAVDLGEGVEVRALAVPHRNEFSDTVGFLVSGPNTRLLYVPDTDAWRAWAEPLEAVLERWQVTAALLDATFYSMEELPGREVASVGHPLVVQSMDLLQGRVDSGSTAVWFTHFNHSNPAVDPDSEARQTIEERGFGVLEDGQELAL